MTRLHPMPITRLLQQHTHLLLRLPPARGSAAAPAAPQTRRHTPTGMHASKTLTRALPACRGQRVYVQCKQSFVNDSITALSFVFTFVLHTL